MKRWSEDRLQNEVVNVELMESYVKDLKRLGPVGPFLGKAVRAIRNARNVDYEDAGYLFDEIKDIGPALDFVQRQVINADVSQRRLHHSYYWIPVRLTIPERYYGTLVQWASVGRTFDNMRGLLRIADGDVGLEEKLHGCQEALNHLQKAIQMVAYHGNQFA